MFGFLETFNRAILAFLSGALLIVGTTFWADAGMWFSDWSSAPPPVSGEVPDSGTGPKGGAFDQVAGMLNNKQLEVIFIVITALTAYVIGIINLAASSVSFRYLVKTTQDEILLISRIESVGRPQVLKEIVELLHVKRTLLAFAFPLFYFGLGLAFDRNEKDFSHVVRISAGLFLVLLSGLAPFLAIRMTRLLEATARGILDETSVKTSVPTRKTGSDPVGEPT